MRKTVRMLGVLALVAVVLTVTPARAEGAAYVGQPIGMVRWSDVKVDIDGMPIRAYELAGCHLVVCEDLPAYGFWVSWDPNVRVVDVRTLEMPERPPVPVDSGGEPGSFAATIYASDIVTYVNGRRIASYNLGGRTAIAVEDLAACGVGGPSQPGSGFSAYGFSCVWNHGKGTMSLRALRPGAQFDCDLGRCTLSRVVDNGDYGYSLQLRPLRLDGVLLIPDMTVVTLPTGNQYAPWAEVAGALGLKWQWDAKHNIISIDARTLSPVEPASGEPDRPMLSWNVRGDSFAIEIGFSVAGQMVEIPRDPWKYVPPDAIVCEGKVFVRFEAIATVLDLIPVAADGFYRKANSAVCWDYTFIPYTGGESEWLASASPSYLGVGRGMIGTVGHERTTPITLTFSRKMDATTLTPENIPVVYKKVFANGRVEYGVISGYYVYTFDEATNTLTISPVSPIELPAGTDVIVAIKPSIADAEGRHPSEGMKIGFYISPDPDVKTGP
ncbi:MAG TPA: Ig-like domain-containing protein [Firmicutes bacterium]|nr:Ig-like domain-containing protein [Candidatus Fermentithermobacillaceae bacterium]